MEDKYRLNPCVVQGGSLEHLPIYYKLKMRIGSISYLLSLTIYGYPRGILKHWLLGFGNILITIMKIQPQSNSHTNLKR